MYTGIHARWLPDSFGNFAMKIEGRFRRRKRRECIGNGVSFSLLWQAVSGKTSRCVELIIQDTFHYGRVLLNDLFCLPDVGFVTIISDGKND
jgi:hypothetical protein